ncbi:hypothetical protein T636_A1496 [Enterobacter hormaechei subsp. xiangfangensis]|nr:hypothetical protein [Enterobacter hormaechei]KHG49268.1 hypothetical protein T636_A1496 [Enterobacter hormaechei subsp. xiangfangensis]
MPLPQLLLSRSRGGLRALFHGPAPAPGSPFNEQFQLAIRESAQAIQNFTTQVGDPTGIATGRMYQTMIEQSRFLAYIDVFTILSAGPYY